MNKYQILIADDEPLVQIGLRSMLARGYDNVEVVGTVANGQEAMEQIQTLHPDIVIADIRMPVMTGLELLRESRKKFGPVPAFIMLTAYEEFDLARQAIEGQAVDYLVKIELNDESLHKAVDRAIERIKPYRQQEAATSGTSSDDRNALHIESFRQRFLLRLLNRAVTSQEELDAEASRIGLHFSYDRYIVIYSIIGAPGTNVQEGDTQHQIRLYDSCLSMSKEILERYTPCCIVSNDLQHFTVIVYFNADQAVATTMQQITEALGNARDMILSYFNVPLSFGIGSAVSAALDIPDSYEEAKTAADCTDDANPVRLFSHVVGARRQSGKDKLIASIQQYIDDNLGGRLQLNEVAKEFGLSSAYLSVMFKKSADIGFSEYVYTKKIEKAKEMLLSNDMKIYEVADALGFESAYYFSRVFKKVEGVSPREYIAKKSQM